MDDDHQNGHRVALLHIADLRIERHAAHEVVHHLQIALAVELMIQHARARNAHVAVNHREESADVVDRLHLDDRNQAREQLPDHVLRRMRVGVEVGEGAHDHQTGVVEIALVVREDLDDRGHHGRDHGIVVLRVLAAIDHDAADAIDGAHGCEHRVVVVLVLLVVLERRQQNAQDVGTHREQAVLVDVDEDVEGLHDLFHSHFLENEDVALHDVLEILAEVFVASRLLREEGLQAESRANAHGEILIVQKTHHVGNHAH